MSFASVHSANRTRFKALVTDTQSVLTVFDNAPYSEPTDGSTWVRWAVLDGESKQIELEFNGMATFRLTGVSVASIFQREGGADDEALALADVIAAAFRRVTASSITYQTPSVSIHGRSGAWHQVNVTCPWFSELIA